MHAPTPSLPDDFDEAADRLTPRAYGALPLRNYKRYLTNLNQLTAFPEVAGVGGEYAIAAVLDLGSHYAALSATVLERWGCRRPT